jgi:hypothetical protein
LEAKMRFRRGTLPDVLFTTGLYLLRRRIGARVESFTGRGRGVYETVSDRLGRTSRAICQNDHRPFSHIGSLLLGVGVGVGVGLLIAPAGGNETRGNIADRIEDLGRKVSPRPAAPSKVSVGAGGT